jgi:hypothetical protein
MLLFVVKLLISLTTQINTENFFYKNNEAIK